MEIIRGTLCFCLLSSSIFAALDDPFPPGYSMGTLGTILWDQGTSGRQPWIPAAYCNDSSGFGLAAGVVLYYDQMNNMEERTIHRTIGGLRYARGFFNVKLFISQLDVLGIYYEHSGALSVGTDLFSCARISIESVGYRISLRDESGDSRTIGSAGFSVWVPFRYASLSMSMHHLVVKKSNAPGADPPLTVGAGVHTKWNRFGAQGILVEVKPSCSRTLRFVLGEEFRLLRGLGIHVAVSNNPVIIGLGVIVDWNSLGVNAALVNHPELGWSKGLFVDYSRRPDAR